MSSIVKQEQHEQESIIFATRHESGTRAMRDWLLARQADINAKWPTAVIEDLPRYQGEAALIAKQLKMIEQGPTIRPLEGNKA